MPRTRSSLVPAPAAIHRARGQRRGHRVTVGFYTAGARKFSERAPIVTHSPALDPAAVSTQPATAAQSAAVGDDDSCFHCGLPVSDDSAESMTVLGEPRRFCCHGCQAVCKTIVEAGLENYYRDREGVSDTGQGDSLEQLMEQLRVYDNEQVQKAFVQHKQDWQEAYLILEGIRCSACIWLNELHLRRQPGIIDVHIDDVPQRARVRWDLDHIRLSQILASIRLIGYQAHPYEPSHYQQLQKENKRKNLQRLIFAAVIACGAG